MSGFALARLLMERRQEIVARFVEEVRRKDLAPSGLSRSLLVDHIPELLDEILRELKDERTVRTSFDALDTSAVGRKHGRQRWGVGYDLETLAREYGILRHCIIEEAMHADVEVRLDEFDILAKCLNVGVTEAVAAYVHRREEELSFLAEASERLSSSLERVSILSRLTRLVVPRVADWCAAYADGVKEIRVAHVDEAKLDALRELQSRLVVAAGSEGPYYRILRGGSAEIVSDTGDQQLAEIVPTEEGRALLREIGARSWMLVPLRVKERTTGAILLGRCSSDTPYSRSDLPLLQELAAKATVALENAHLYELSQQARSRVEAATRAKDEFVAMVSHELRTPLNVILGWMRFHRTGTLSEDKKDHAFRVVERNAEALNGLVANGCNRSSGTCCRTQ